MSAKIKGFIMYGASYTKESFPTFVDGVLKHMKWNEEQRAKPPSRELTFTEFYDLISMNYEEWLEIHGNDEQKAELSKNNNL
jgi:hypothetical protein